MREREKENMIYFLRKKERGTERVAVLLIDLQFAANCWIESKLDDNCKHKKRNLARKS